MNRPPRVVLVLDPRPGDLPADRLELPEGGRLADLVGSRAVAEAGELDGTVTGAAGVAELLARPGTEPEASPGRSLCLVDAGALALPTTYGDVVADPREEPAALATEGGRVVAVRLDPATRADPQVRDLLARALRGATPGSALTVLAGALTAAGHPVRPLTPGLFPLTVVGDPETLAAARSDQDGRDEAALRLRRSSRSDDGFLSTFLVRPLSRRLTRVAVRAGIRPDPVTGCSFLLGLLAAAAYCGGGLGWRLAGSVLLLLSLVVDCVDGEVARYTRTFSPLGGWLDISSDRVKEYAVYAGVAVGAAPRAWGFAAAAFAVLVFRHFVDFGYAATVSGTRAGDNDAGTSGADPVAAWSARTSARSGLMWAKRAVIMPAGERTILLAVLVPAVGARWGLGVLLVLGGIAAAYTLAGRFGRLVLARRRTPVSVAAGERLRAQVDAGWLGRMLPAPGGRLGWLGPAAARAVEQGGLALLVALVRPGALAAAYLLLAAVAIHQYDVVYRQRLAGAVGDRSLLGRVGWPARVVVVAALTLLVPSAGLRVVLLLAGLVLLVLAGVDSVTWWSRFVRSARQSWATDGEGSVA